MLMDVDGGTVLMLDLLNARNGRFHFGGQVHALLLLYPFSQVGMNVLRQVILTVEPLPALGAPMHLVRPVDDRMPLQMLLEWRNCR